ncbi:hypothetical protein SAMN02745225_02349 [Ferrithrix thermotolerans DSM 19514]|uniref:Uncharacterized protein n=1 Tax=Ferrithrix thermotolerans DSM 19514 TaxID=1121881 RepID=A0A1M4YIW7_9ACTN|nr:hypothetical protein [Ferrithrix thermotolerans]SHF05583.1 hypothetical protein SAMN02745225_02349 [Ferrithrix thermotolerans DSM 19514]
MDAICAVSPIGIGGRVQYFGSFDLMERLTKLLNALRAQQRVASKQVSPQETAASRLERSEILKLLNIIDEYSRE